MNQRYFRQNDGDELPGLVALLIVALLANVVRTVVWGFLFWLASIMITLAFEVTQLSFFQSIVIGFAANVLYVIAHNLTSRDRLCCATAATNRCVKKRRWASPLGTCFG